MGPSTHKVPEALLGNPRLKEPRLPGRAYRMALIQGSGVLLDPALPPTSLVTPHSPIWPCWAACSFPTAVPAQASSLMQAVSLAWHALPHVYSFVGLL